jgi:MSHA pilin protein MshC
MVRNLGFTLVELIMTMVIVGVLAAVVAPRFFDNNVFQERGTADQIRAALRYGQKIAVAQRRQITVTIRAAGTTDCGAVLVAGAVDCAVSDRVQIIPALPQIYRFNGLGSLDLNAANLPITVGASNTINVAPETGYVQ